MIAAFSMAAVVTPLAAAPASAMQNKVIVDFETQNYVVTPFDYVPGGDPTAPQAASVVASAQGNVTHSLKNTRGYQGWAGTTFFDSAGTQLISDGNLTVTADVNSPVAGVVIRLKVEDSTNNTHTLETNATEASVVGWHTYTFDLSAQATGTAAFNSTYNYDKATAFFDFIGATGSVTTSGQDFYLDNVTFPGETTPAVGVDFETVGDYVVGPFDYVPDGIPTAAQAASVVTDAPGNSTKVLKSTRGYQNWAGTNFFKKANTVLISEADLVVTAEINAPTAGVALRMKLENSLDGNMSVETDATEVSVVGWHTYTFNFANQATGTAAFNNTKTYDSANLFFDFIGATGSVTTSGLNYYMDNVIFPGQVTPPQVSTAPSTIATFETGDAAAIDVANKATPEHTLGVFGGDANSAVIVTAGPAGGKGGKVLAVTKNGAEWSGINVIADETGTVRYTNAENPKVSFNYYAPHAGPVVVELGPSKVQATAQALRGWQTITVDFSVADQVTSGTWSSSVDYRKVSIFPDFLVSAGGNTFYFDDVAVNGATTPAITYVAPAAISAASTLLTFESNDAAGLDVANLATALHPLGVFGGNSNVAAIADGPARGNVSKVLAVTKAGEAWTGINAIKDTTGDLRFTNAQHPIVSFNYYAPKAGPVAVELSPGPVRGLALAVAGWQTISIDFSKAAQVTSGSWSSSTEYNTVSIFPDYMVAASNPAAVYYFDNIAVNGAVTPAVTPVVTPPTDTKVKPANTVKASFTGTAKVGKTLTAKTGTWTGNPAPTFSYKWYRCSVKGSSTSAAAPARSAKCVAIRGATKSTYKLAAADKGKYVRVAVTASNSEGSAITTTKSTSKKVVK